MPEFIADSTLETIHSLVSDLNNAVTAMGSALLILRDTSGSAGQTVSPQDFVEKILALDEQISRTRLLLPLCTSGVHVNEEGRTLPLSELIMEIRSEFDSLARAQLEVLIDGAADQSPDSAPF